MKNSEKNTGFSTLKLVEYRKSNTVTTVYFETFAEAEAFAKEQKRLHPRTKKLNGYVYDIANKKSIRVV